MRIAHYADREVSIKHVPSADGSGGDLFIHQTADVREGTPSAPSSPPGAFDATRAGCTCPPLVNHFGRGASESAAGARQYVIAPTCSLHREEP